MTWLDKILPPGLKRSEGTAKGKSVPEGLWIKCPSCDSVLYSTDLENNLNVCPKCEHHMRLTARARLDRLLDADGRTEIGQEVRPLDPLKFKDSRKYPDRLTQAAAQSSETEAMVVMSGSIHTLSVVVACFEFEFMGGSMGSVVGEKLARAGLRALERNEPLLIVSASGGARMMEGIFSLMQMAKTSAVLAQMNEAGLPYIAILTDPTTGGVTASYAMLGDANLAEPGTLIGFAGPRVIEQTIKQELPDGFQRAEFLLEHGMLDGIVDRRRMKREVSRLLRHMTGRPAPEETFVVPTEA